MVVEQTNLHQKLNPAPLRSTIAPWKDVNIEELGMFFGLLINMGHVIKGNHYFTK